MRKIVVAEFVSLDVVSGCFLVPSAAVNERMWQCEHQAHLRGLFKATQVGLVTDQTDG